MDGVPILGYVASHEIITDKKALAAKLKLLFSLKAKRGSTPRI